MAQKKSNRRLSWELDSFPPKFVDRYWVVSLRESERPLINIKSFFRAGLVVALLDWFLCSSWYHGSIDFMVSSNGSIDIKHTFSFKLKWCDSTNVWKQIQNRKPCSCKQVLCWPVCTVWHCLFQDSLQMWTSGVSGTEIARLLWKSCVRMGK